MFQKYACICTILSVNVCVCLFQVFPSKAHNIIPSFHDGVSQGSKFSTCLQAEC